MCTTIININIILMKMFILTATMKAIITTGIAMTSVSVFHAVKSLYCSWFSVLLMFVSFRFLKVFIGSNNTCVCISLTVATENIFSSSML